MQYLFLAQDSKEIWACIEPENDYDLEPIVLCHFDTDYNDVIKKLDEKSLSNSRETYVAGKFDNCITGQNGQSFLLTNTYTPKSGTLEKELTTEFWFKYTGAVNGMFQVRCVDTDFINLTINGNTLLYNSQSICEINSDEWIHFAHIYTDREQYIFVNGKKYEVKQKVIPTDITQLLITFQGSNVSFDEFAVFGGIRYYKDFEPPTSAYVPSDDNGGDNGGGTDPEEPSYSDLDIKRRGNIQAALQFENSGNTSYNSITKSTASVGKSTLAYNANGKYGACGSIASGSTSNSITFAGNTTGITVEFWMKAAIPSTTGQNWTNRFVLSVQSSQSLQLKASNTYFVYNCKGGGMSDDNILNGVSVSSLASTWYHFAITYSNINNTLQIFVNGVKKVTTTFSTVTPAIGNINLTYYGGTCYFDEVYVYNAIIYDSNFTPSLLDVTGL